MIEKKVIEVVNVQEGRSWGRVRRRLKAE